MPLQMVGVAARSLLSSEDKGRGNPGKQESTQTEMVVKKSAKPYD